MSTLDVTDLAVEPVTDPAGPGPIHPPAGPGRTRWRRLARDPTFAVAATILAIVAIGSVFAGVLAPYDPLHQDLRDAFALPSRAHLLGTDELGRDVLSRLLFAGRISLGAAVLAVSIALLIGVPIGMIAGYRGGHVEAFTMRMSDGVMALPGLIIIIAIIGVFGNGIAPAMAALGLVLAPSVLRLSRGVSLSVRHQPYVDSARILGLRSPRIIVRHVLPQVLPTLVVQASLLLGAALLIEAGLSFLGLGIQPPHAGWGSMLAKAGSVYRRQPFLLIPPGVAITATVLSFNLVGDSVRDVVLGSDGSSRRPPRRRPGVTVEPAVGTVSSDGTQAIDEPTALSVRDLTVAFRSGTTTIPAVTDVCLRLRRGRTLGLVGESGCGKTITARAVMDLLPPGAAVVGGSVRLGDEELVGLDDRAMSRIRGDRISMVFQDPSSSLDPLFTIGSQVGESLRRHRGLSRRAARLAAIELLGQVGIADRARRVDAYPDQFSGGMLQRVSIAAALACDPDVLIADEPTTALDVTVQADILNLLRRLQTERAMAIVLVTHDLGVVADACDDVAVMYAGQVVETAPVAAIFDDPRHPYTRALMEAAPRPEHKGHLLPTISGQVPPLQQPPVGCRFADRCPLAVDDCRAHPIDVVEVGVDHSARCTFAARVPV